MFLDVMASPPKDSFSDDQCESLTTITPITPSPSSLAKMIIIDDKNLLWGELNVLKRKLNVNIKNTINDYRFKSSILG